MNEFSVKTPNPVVQAIKSWIGERTVSSDVLDQDDLLLAIQREIGHPSCPRHKEILEDVKNARAIIAEEVFERTEAQKSEALMGRRTPEEREIAEAGQDAGC